MDVTSEIETKNVQPADRTGIETKITRTGNEPERGNVFSEIRDTLDGITQAFDAYRSGSEEKIAGAVERIEALEARAMNPRLAGNDHRDADDIEHKQRFLAWMRNPRDPMAMGRLGEIEAAISKKDMSIGSNADGGFAVPKEIVATIEKLELKLSPVRNLVKVLQSGTSDFHHLVAQGGTESGWSSETGTRSGTTTPKLRDVAPTHGELYAYPTVSNWSLDDIFFDLAAWLAGEVSESFASQEGQAVIDGNGTNKPTGMLNTTPVLTSDFASPLRDQDAYQYIACDLDILGSPQAPGITGDLLIDCVYTLNAKYRAGASWIMNSTTAGAVRKLKDSQGRYLWTDGLQAGQPAMLLGYPVATWEQMPDIGANNFPVGFGNWARAYLLVDRVGLRITRDEVTTPGLTKFYVRRREGGRVLNNDAAKFIRTIQ